MAQKKKVVNPLFRMMEKRFGVKVKDEILISVSNISYEDGRFHQLSIDESITKIVKRYSSKDYNISTIGDIYDLMNSETYMSTSLSKIPNVRCISYTPILQITINRRTSVFRLDNQFLKEMLQDSEIILNGLEGYYNLTQEDFDIRSKENLKFHMGYFDSIRNNTTDKWWDDYFDSCDK